MDPHAEGLQDGRVQAAVVAGAEGADEDRRPGQKHEHAAHKS